MEISLLSTARCMQAAVDNSSLVAGRLEDEVFDRDTRLDALLATIALDEEVVEPAELTVCRDGRKMFVCPKAFGKYARAGVVLLKITAKPAVNARAVGIFIMHTEEWGDRGRISDPKTRDSRQAYGCDVAMQTILWTIIL